MRNICWLLALMLPMTATAQSPITHNHENPDVIDGAKTPELIPDSTAWRLWMLAVTQKDPRHLELDQQRQDAYLRIAGFRDEDLPAIREVLSDFRSAYDSMLQDHNLAEAAGQNPSLASLKTQRDLLVKQAQENLLFARTGIAEKIQTFVNGEKKRMLVSKTEVQ